MFLRTFGGSLLVAVVGLVLGFLYGGATGLALAAILAVLEVSLSFDNAVVNATVLVRMSPFWQKIFLTVGVAIAVFGMRLVFPLLIVGITASLTPAEAAEQRWRQRRPNGPCERPRWPSGARAVRTRPSLKNGVETGVHS